MNFKKTLPALVLALLMLFSVSAAMAQPKEKTPPPPPAKAQMSDEDWAAMKALREEHRIKLDPIRDQLWAKRLEYDALVANPNSKHEDIKAVIEEMRKLKVQEREEKLRHRTAMEAKGFEPGPGRHWRGPGPDDDFRCYDRGPDKKFPKGGHKKIGPHHEVD